MPGAPRYVVFSVDFELRWGVADLLGTDMSRYRRNLDGVKEVVPALLELFGQRKVRATWATVGALACESWDDFEENRPQAPLYRQASLNLDFASLRAGDRGGQLHFAPALVRQICSTVGQELGSHTFSHIYMCEQGVRRSDVDADFSANRRLFQNRFGVIPKSLVFPRNQIGFLDVARDHGIVMYRANPKAWYWNISSGSSETKIARAMRLADALLPLKSRSFAASEPHRSSQFVRFELPEAAFRLHRARILRDIAKMQAGEVFHLWFHPHNLGASPVRSLQRLTSILDAIEALGQIEYRSMGDFGSP